jgi:hypothetical protein
MASTISKSDIISAITLYLASNERENCPLAYLIDEKFGRSHKKHVTKLVADLKKAGAIVGKRGRTGGLCFPESATVEAAPVESDNTEIEVSAEDTTLEQDGMVIEPVPF